MNLYFRLLATLVLGLRRARLPHDATSTRRFRVWPHDLDAFGHMNNGRYLQIMDVARTDWMLRTGVLGAMRRERWSAVLGGAVTRYRRALRLGRRFEVRTVLLCWDHRWFFFEHKFVDRTGDTVAVGMSRAALRARGDWLHTSAVVDAVSPRATSPAPPDYLAVWMDADARMLDAAQTRTGVGCFAVREITP